jgi:hypothetical protein
MLNLFISHSWDHNDHREGLHDLISKHWQQHIDWMDTSVPRHAPLHISGGKALKAALRERIACCDALVVFAGMYSSYSEWIEFEVLTAAAQFKPIIGVKPWAQQKLSQVVVEDASELVGWNSASVCNGILRWLPASTYRRFDEHFRQKRALQAWLNSLPKTGNSSSILGSPGVW